MSQRRSRAAPQTEEVDPSLNDAIVECARFIICRDGSKIPIKRAEILKHLSTTCQINSNKVNTVVAEANKILKRVYGYKLVQVDAKSGIQYILVLTKPCQSVQSTVTDPNQRRLLMAALTHIFMTGVPVVEEDMWNFLEEAGLMEANDIAARKHFISTFTKQLYLSYSKVGEGDFARFVFEWGQRAMEEVPKMFILEKMAEAFDKEPSHWYEQYKVASEEIESAVS